MARPLKFQSVEELQQKIDEFFSLVKEGEYAPSVISLAVHLDCHKGTIVNYQEKDKFKPVIEAAKEKIEMLFTQRSYNGEIPPAIFIFTAKNHYEYKDSQDFNHGGQKDNPLDIVMSDINNRSAGLPSEDK